jgi:hypothetical protein
LSPNGNYILSPNPTDPSSPYYKRSYSIGGKRKTKRKTKRKSKRT